MDNIIINIDSRFRNKQIYNNAGKFTYQLSEKIKNCKYVRLSSFEFPNLYFTFTEKKNNISFKLICNSKEYVVTITEGYYASDTLLLEIQEQFDKANIYMQTEFKILFNYNNGFCTIENGTAYFRVEFSNYPSRYPSLGYQLGFRKDNYLSSTAVVSGEAIYSIITESQLDTIGEQYIFLKLNDYGIIFHDYEDIITKDSSGEIILREKYVGDKNVFAKIILNTNKAEQVFDNGSNFLTKSYIFRQPIDLDRFNISLSDPRGNIIDMVHMDFSLTLEIGIIYDSSLQNELTDTILNKFMTTGLPNLPILDNISKKNKNINIVNDNTNKKNNLKTDVYSIFENDNNIILNDNNIMLYDTNSNNNIVKKEKNKQDNNIMLYDTNSNNNIVKKERKKKFNFNY
jgi:hypothetical protein